MANLKNTEIDNNLELPQGTTAQRPASPQEGQIRYNTDLGVTEFYNGSNWRPLSDTHPEATGGTVVDTDIGGVPYRIHYFTETGTDTFTVTNPGEVEYLIVAGGGGGGDTSGGGGGAGGVITGSTYASVSTYTFTVGAGGEGSNAYSSGTSGDGGDKGNNSTAFGLTALGGGGGGSYSGSSNIINGGSGGGVRGDGQNRSTGASGGIALQPTSASGGFGNDGGDTPELSNGAPSSGGGGAGSPGQDCTNEKGGDGGQGLVFGITGANLFYAGGGGGSGGYIARGGGVERNGIGGIGGGGNGGRVSRFQDDPFIEDGVPNTGGGGGGGGYDDGGNPAGTKGGGTGGSGIVVVRYPRNSSLSQSPQIQQGRDSSAVFVPLSDTTEIITQSGLQINLDAANYNSYPGSGNTWTDLSGNGYDVTLINSPSFNPQGYISFNGIDQYGEQPVPGFSSGSESYTFEIWFKMRVLPTDQYEDNGHLWGGQNGNNLVMYVNPQNNGTSELNMIHDDSRYNNSGAQTRYQISADTWTHWIVCWDTNTRLFRHYINGNEDRLDSPILPSSQESSSWPSTVYVAHDTRWNTYSTLDVSVLRYYNRTLDYSEVVQNFQAHRGRHGI